MKTITDNDFLFVSSSCSEKQSIKFLECVFYEHEHQPDIKRLVNSFYFDHSKMNGYTLKIKMNGMRKIKNSKVFKQV